MSATSGTEPSDHPWRIPKSWIWTTMGVISDVVGGGTPRTDEPSNWLGGEVPWITPADLSGYGQKTIARGSRCITQEGLEGSGAQLLPAGAILFSSRAPIGYVAIAANSVSTNQGFKSFIVSPALCPDYVYYFLMGNKALATSLASGTTFLELSAANAARIPIALPPRGEQDRIVASIEEQLTRLDAAVTTLRRVQATLRRCRAAMLMAACDGRLVSNEAELARTNGRDYEPASDLLARIVQGSRPMRDTRRSRIEGGAPAPAAGDGALPEYHPSSSVELTASPRLPEGWAWTTVEQISEKVQYGTSAKASTTPGVPILRMANILDGRISVRSLKYLPEDHDEFPELLLKPGDVLFNRTNSADLVGKTATYAGRPGRCSFASYLIRVRLLQGICPEWLTCYLNSPYGRSWVSSVVSQQVGQANVNGTKLRSLSVPIPPLAEQRRIVEELERRLSHVAETEGVVASSLKRAERLKQSILKQAFRGELVPQNPHDEPAHLLIERIRTERAVGTVVTPRRANGPRRPAMGDDRVSTATTAASRELK